MVVAHAFSHSTGKQRQPGLQSEFEDSQDCYTETPCLERVGGRGRRREKEKEENAKGLQRNSGIPRVSRKECLGL